MKDISKILPSENGTLDLSNQGIDDKTLHEIINSFLEKKIDIKITNLNLSFNDLSSNCIGSLLQLKNLHELDISNNKFTEKNFKKLLDANPTLLINASKNTLSPATFQNLEQRYAIFFTKRFLATVWTMATARFQSGSSFYGQPAEIIKVILLLVYFETVPKPFRNSKKINEKNVENFLNEVFTNITQKKEQKRIINWANINNFFTAKKSESKKGENEPTAPVTKSTKKCEIM